MKIQTRRMAGAAATAALAFSAIPALTACAQPENSSGKPSDGPDAPQAPRRPNVLLLVADDLGWGDLGFHGSVIPTPVLDRFASESIELCRYYAAPLSSPTRAGLLTGRYPSRFSIRQTVLPPWRKTGLPMSERTIADILGDFGYENRALIGKWHLGHGEPGYHPMLRGFNHFYGFLNGNLDYFTHIREGELDWHNDYDSCYDEGYTTDLIGDEAARCIGEYSKSGSPFLLYVAFNAPHSPYQAPEDEIAELIPLDEFNSLPAKDRKGWTYRAMVSRMDKNIGKILDALKASGQYDDTIILFMSDNGGVPDMEPYCTNFPFRGRKGTEWEGGCRVSAVIRWNNGFMTGGRKLEQVTGFVDILPTICDIIGDPDAAERGFDGISMYPVLSGREESIVRDMYLGLGAMVNSRYKLILPGRNDGVGISGDFFTDIRLNPSEQDGRQASDTEEMERMKRLTVELDNVEPIIPELPFNEGKNGFVAPKEWNIF